MWNRGRNFWQDQINAIPKTGPVRINLKEDRYKRSRNKKFRKGWYKKYFNPAYIPVIAVAIVICIIFAGSISSELHKQNINNHLPKTATNIVEKGNGWYEYCDGTRLFMYNKNTTNLSHIGECERTIQEAEYESNQYQ